jgi:hypothetical protein
VIGKSARTFADDAVRAAQRVCRFTRVFRFHGDTLIVSPVARRDGGYHRARRRDPQCLGIGLWSTFDIRRLINDGKDPHVAHG